jgi:hypothetical protein
MQRLRIALMVMGIVSAWFGRSTADGQISPEEIVELLTEIAAALGFADRLTINVS